MAVQLDVPRETIVTIESYLHLLYSWNKKINLISRQISKDELWQNQVLDAVFLSQIITEGEIIDIGSGGGFPAVVLAICSDRNLTLVERNYKKAVFLRSVKTNLNLNYQVIASDVREITPKHFDVITSKAMTSCVDLIELCQNLIGAKTHVFLLKNASQQDELKILADKWHFKINLHNNKYNNSMVFELYNLTRK
jgi:16S rRNA (guanine527-N7)-methyltransferase